MTKNLPSRLKNVDVTPAYPNFAPLKLPSTDLSSAICIARSCCEPCHAACSFAWQVEHAAAPTNCAGAIATVVVGAGVGCGRSRSVQNVAAPANATSNSAAAPAIHARRGGTGGRAAPTGKGIASSAWRSRGRVARIGRWDFDLRLKAVGRRWHARKSLCRPLATGMLPHCDRMRRRIPSKFGLRGRMGFVAPRQGWRSRNGRQPCRDRVTHALSHRKVPDRLRRSAVLDPSQEGSRRRVRTCAMAAAEAG